MPILIFIFCLILPCGLNAQLVINEIFFKPYSSPQNLAGDLNGSGRAGVSDQFIELVNSSSSEVDITGWSISVRDNRGELERHIFDSTYVSIGQAVVVTASRFPNVDFGGSIVNEASSGGLSLPSSSFYSGVVLLYDDQDNVVDEVAYSGGEAAGSSLVRIPEVVGTSFVPHAWIGDQSIPFTAGKRNNGNLFLDPNAESEDATELIGYTSAGLEYFNERDRYQVINGVFNNPVNLYIPPTIRDLPIDNVGVGAFSDEDKIVNLRCSDNLRAILSSGFSRNNNLETVTFGKGLTILLSSCFYSCNNLSAVNFDEESSLRKIDINVFSNCSSLSLINLPEGLESIGDGAFNGAGLESLHLPASVVSVGVNPFFDCESLTQFTVAENNSFFSVIGGTLCDSISLDLISFPSGQGVGSYEVEAPIKRIGPKAFYGVGLTEVILPDTLETIGNNAFQGSNLNSIIIPDSLLAVGEYAFRDCRSLQSLSFGSNLNTVGGRAFLDCERLSSVVFQNGLISIGDRAFSGTNLGKVVFLGPPPTMGDAVFDGVSIGAKVVVAPQHLQSFGGEDQIWNGLVVERGSVEVQSEPVSLELLALEQAVFEVSASSDLPINYEWRKNGVVIDGATSERLVIESVSTDHIGEYQCLVSNEFGSVLSDSASLLVQRLPQEIVFDSFQTITDQTARLESTAFSDSGLPITYQSSNTSVAEIEGESILIISNGSSEITASQGGNNVYLPAQSIVRELMVARGVRINSSTGSMVVPALSNVSFSVDVTSLGLASFQWRKDGEIIFDATDRVLTIENVTLDEQGSYTCLVSDNFGMAISTPAFLTVQRLPQSVTFSPIEFGDEATSVVIEASSASGLPLTYSSSAPQFVQISGEQAFFLMAGSSVITASNEGDNVYLPVQQSQTVTVSDALTIIASSISKEVDAKSDVEFFASAVGRGLLSYQWFKEDVPLNGATLPVLSLSNVSETASGQYWCVITDGIQSQEQTDTITLTVNKITQEINFPPQDPLSLSLSNFQLTATSDSGLPVRYLSSDTSIASIGPDGNLVINGAGTAVIGAYQDGNSYYEPAQPVIRNLIVENDLLLSRQPSPQEVSALTTALFSVEATSRVGVSYQWKKDGIEIEGATMAELELQSVSTDDEGFYSCVVSNAFGAIESLNATLTVSRLPQIIHFELVDEISADVGEIALAATVDSSLPLSFISSDESIVTIDGGKLILLNAGSVVITASQDGDEVYLPADPIEQELTVLEVSAPELALENYYESLPNESLSIDATPVGGLTDRYTYQWSFNDFLIPEAFGGTSAIQVIAGLEGSEGRWRVVVTNPMGSAEHSFDYRVKVDTDGDGYSDGYEELVLGTDPELSDTDGDGLDDFAEVEIHKTNPRDEDSDEDGYIDGFEIANDSDPLRVNSKSLLRLEMELSQIAGLPALNFVSNPVNGGLFAIEQSFDLRSWTPIVFFNGTGVSYETRVISPENRKAFYRLKVLDQSP